MIYCSMAEERLIVLIKAILADPDQLARIPQEMVETATNLIRCHDGPSEYPELAEYFERRR